jgi:hypothetical protein
VSDYTATKPEVLYANIAQGTQLATFTTEASLMGGLLECEIPALYFLNNTSVGRTLRIRASGRLGTTTTGPTFQWFIRLFTHGTAFSAGGGILLGSSPALTAAVSQTLAPWFLDADIVMQNVNPGATSQISTMGEVRSYKGLVSPFGGSIPDNNVNPQISTYDRNATYDLYLSVACGTSNAANLINLQQMKLYGEN